MEFHFIQVFLILNHLWIYEQSVHSTATPVLFRLLYSIVQHNDLNFYQFSKYNSWEWTEDTPLSTTLVVTCTRKKTVGKINGILGCVWIFLINLFEIRNLTSKKKYCHSSEFGHFSNIYKSCKICHNNIMDSLSILSLSYFF